MRVRRLVGATVLAVAAAIAGAGTAAASDGPHDSGRHDSRHDNRHDSRYGNDHGRWGNDDSDDGWEVEGHYARRGEHGHYYNVGGPYGLTHAGGGKHEQTAGFELERDDD